MKNVIFTKKIAGRFLVFFLGLSVLLALQTTEVIAQTYPPSCIVTSPYSNAYFKAGTDVEIHVYSTDIGKSTNNGTVTKVEFFNGNTKLGETSTYTNYTYKFIWSCVPAGTYTIKAKATNDRGVSFTSVGNIITVGTANVTQRGMSACKGKYLANIIAGSPNINYNTYWNGVTAENSCKWGSIEGNRDVMNWGGADVSYNHAKNNNLMFRWHAALWAAQRPSWLFGLSTADARAELVEYMQAIAARYPLIDQIDVLNEQLGNHQADNQLMRDKFSGITNCPPNNFSWQIWLFEQARAIFPNTKLVLNDYGIENDRNAINMTLDLFKVLRDRGLVDGFGTQAHCFNIDGLTANFLKESLDIMDNSGVPTYVTELDLNGRSESNDNAAVQLASYQTHFPVYWDHPSVAGITLWGYVTGATWIGGTGLMSSNGTEKSAMTWLKQYVSGKPSVGYPICASEGCTNSGQISLSITSPTEGQTFTTADPITFSVSATDGNGTISNVKIYDGTTLLTTINSAPYTYNWTGATVGTHQIKVVATDNQGNTSEATVTVKVNLPQGPYNGTWHLIPGTIQLEHFDEGGNGFAYSDNTPGSEVTPVVNYRTNEDVDIETCTDAGAGYNLGWTAAGEWLEYSVEVEKPGTYNLAIRAACNGAGRTVSVSMDGVDIAADVAIPNTAGWQTWQTVTVNNVNLKAGKQIMRLTIGATDYVNLNYVTFTLVKELIQEPFNGSAHIIPGRIEIEEYDLGGEGLAYHEGNTNGNEGLATLRNDEVDIEETGDADGDYNLGYVLNGEWLEYTVDVISTGIYNLQLRVAADGDGKLMHIEIDGEDVTGPIEIPNTGGWQIWETITINEISLTGGEHIMRLVFESDYMNLNYLEFNDVITGLNEKDLLKVKVFPNPFSDKGLSIDQAGDFRYSIADVSGSMIESGIGMESKTVGSNLNPGVYFITIRNEYGVSVHKIVKK